MTFQSTTEIEIDELPGIIDACAEDLQPEDGYALVGAGFGAVNQELTDSLIQEGQYIQDIFERPTDDDQIVILTAAVSTQMEDTEADDHGVDDELLETFNSTVEDAVETLDKHTHIQMANATVPSSRDGKKAVIDQANMFITALNDYDKISDKQEPSSVVAGALYATGKLLHIHLSYSMIEEHLDVSDSTTRRYYQEIQEVVHEDIQPGDGHETLITKNGQYMMDGTVPMYLLNNYTP